MRKYYLNYRKEWKTVESVIEEVVQKTLDGPFDLKAWSPNLIAYIAQTTIKAWEDEKSRKKSQ